MTSIEPKYSPLSANANANAEERGGFNETSESQALNPKSGHSVRKVKSIKPRE